MVVGVLKLDLRLHGVQSLKDKRSVVRRVIDRTRAKFHCAAAETGRNDAHGEAELGFTMVGNEAAFVAGCLDRVANFVESLHLAEVVGQDMETFHYP